MEAMLIETELKKTMRGHYFVIELLDKHNVRYIIDKPTLSDNINFRRETYGIINASDENDLLRLSTSNPIRYKVNYYYENGVKYIENRGKSFYYDSKSRLYKVDEIKHSTDKEECLIDSILFKDGCAKIVLESPLSYRNIKTSLIDFDETVKSENRASASTYHSFVVSLMNFLNKKDILSLGGNIERYPEVDIKVCGNNVKRLSNPYTGKSLYITNKYEISDKK